MPARVPALALPHPDDPPDVWRRFARGVASDTTARQALLAAVPAQSPAVRDATVPALLVRARGAARAEVLRAVVALSAVQPPSPPVLYVLVGELLGSAGPSRAPCVAALTRAAPDDRRAVALALSAAGHVRAVRDAGERERAALTEWTRAGGDDPLRGHDPEAAWRAWVHGPDVPPGLDHALLLATAGAPRALVEQLRKVVEHLVLAAVPVPAFMPTPTPESAPASAGAVALVRWLATECVRGDDLPASVRNPGWLTTAARVLARCAIATAGHAASLRHVAEVLHSGDLERAAAVEVVRACVGAARRGPCEAVLALGDTVRTLVDALAAAPPGADPTYATLVALLLGRDAVTDPGDAPVEAARWLTDDLRACVHALALDAPALGARRVALADLEAHGVPPVVVPLLRDVARTDPDPVTRQHARQLARGERL